MLVTWQDKRFCDWGGADQAVISGCLAKIEEDLANRKNEK